ncbi:MAG: histidine phosphatase family protein [Ilumatobacteraceae bacterium]
MSGTRIILVRHGESHANAGRFIGGLRSCTGLTDHGRLQVERLRDRLLAAPEFVATALWSSSYPRAIETARILSQAVGSLPVEVDARWGEHDPGPDCDGMKYDDFVKRWGQPNWDGDPYDVTYPGGETKADFFTRIKDALRRTVEANEGGTVVVACHGGVVDVAMRIALHAPVNGKFELHTTNASMTEVVHVAGPKWRLVRYNDSSHLTGA